MKDGKNISASYNNSIFLKKPYLIYNGAPKFFRF